MIRCWLSLVLLLPLAQLGQAQQPKTLWNITLTNCSGTYRVSVVAQQEFTTLDITYVDESGKTVVISHHKGERSYLYAWPISVVPSGLVAVWECGTGICTTVFPLALKPSEPVFDEWSESAPDFVTTNAGQVMLFYSGKRYPQQPSGLWEPREAALYLWTHDQYKLVTKVPYEQRFTALAEMQPTNGKASASPCNN